MALGKAIAGVVNQFGREPERTQRLENVCGSAAAHLDDGPAHSGVVEVAPAVLEDLTMRDRDLGWHSEVPHYREGAAN